MMARPAPASRPTSDRLLAASFFRRHPSEVARALLGHVLIVREDDEIVGGRIVETEAYHVSEPAAHSHRGETARNRAMFARAPHTYVYRSYGLHWCFNLVTGEAGDGSAVLIRALEPTRGIATMAARRGAHCQVPFGLCRGPGNVTQALGIHLGDNDQPLGEGRIAVLARRGRAAYDPETIAVSPRVGITKAAHLPWRFFFLGHPCVSGPRKPPAAPSGPVAPSRR